MTTFLLLHGAGSDGWYWHRVLPLLPDAVAPDLPVTDESCGFEEYADAAANGVTGPVTVVAQSLAGFVAPLLCSRLDVREIRLVAAMTPAPGESAGEWWDATGQTAARREADRAARRDPDAELDPLVTFLHDVPPDVVEAGWPHVFAQASRPFHDPWPLDAWPDVPTRFLAATEDRLFPLAFQRRLVRERLGVDVEEIEAGHLPALSTPDALAAWLLS
ncbi:MAG: hydrolase, alpha/beta fold family protein [Frankiales bacterium]|nr:hydrolase, alpha/beta fold family protein [Frankiales bacterium]